METHKTSSMPSLPEGLKSIGFILSSNRFEGLNFHFLIAKTAKAAIPTTEDKTIITIKAVLLNPPVVLSLWEFEAPALALDEDVIVAVTTVTLLLERVATVEAA